MIRRVFLLAALAVAGLTACGASADPVGTPIIAGSNVSELKLTFLGASAGYNNQLFYLTVAGTPIFEINGGTPASVGDTVTIPASLLAGDEIVFALHVVNTNENLYSGDGINGPSAANPFRSSDPNGYGNKYASVVPVIAGQSWNVGFEDITGAPDDDFNDLEFSVAIVPEPASVLAWTLIGGTFAFGAWRRNKKAAV